MKPKLLEKLFLPLWYTRTRNLMHQESVHTQRVISLCAETLASAQMLNIPEQGRDAWMVRTPRGWASVDGGCEVRP